jgi:hypothetical protein
MRGSKAKRLRRRIFGVGYHWPTVKADKRLRSLHRQLKKAKTDKRLRTLYLQLKITKANRLDLLKWRNSTD